MFLKFALEVAPILGAVLITISYLPQLKHTITTKNVSGQSVGFWILLSGSLLFLTIQQWGVWTTIGSWSGLFTQSVNLFFALTMLIMVIKHKKE